MSYQISFMKSYNQSISFILYDLRSLEGTCCKISGSTFASFCGYEWKDCTWSTQQKPLPYKRCH